MENPHPESPLRASSTPFGKASPSVCITTLSRKPGRRSTVHGKPTRRIHIPETRAGINATSGNSRMPGNAQPLSAIQMFFGKVGVSRHQFHRKAQARRNPRIGQILGRVQAPRSPERPLALFVTESRPIRQRLNLILSSNRNRRMALRCAGVRQPGCLYQQINRSIRSSNFRRTGTSPSATGMSGSPPMNLRSVTATGELCSTTCGEGRSFRHEPRKNISPDSRKNRFASLHPPADYDLQRDKSRCIYKSLAR